MSGGFPIARGLISQPAGSRLVDSLVCRQE
jgi:hypothetical protein